MLAGPLVFVDVDTQRDFMEPTGTLFVPGSTEIVANLARLTAFAREQGIPILATACAHSLDEADPEPFPPHCLIGTPGQARIGATSWPDTRVVDLDETPAIDALPPHLTLHKCRYDLFSHAAAESLIDRYARDRPTFVVYGVATDYCVKAAVLGLLARGQKVAVVADAIRAVDPAAEADVLGEFTARGAMLVLTEVVVSPAAPATARGESR